MQNTPAQPAAPASLKADVLAGFLVFLIALPLCLSISLASGYPLIAGIFTAIIGGIVTTFISNSELTIKGPAAGLIVIALGCVLEFGGGQTRKPDMTEADIQAMTDANLNAYRLALAVGVAAGVIQLALGLLKLGDVIGDFFPTAAVHGMLASIGVIIAVKMFHVAFGVQDVKGGPFAQMAAIPDTLMKVNWPIATIGLSGLLILFGMPWIRNRHVRMIPAPLVVMLVAIPLGIVLDLHHTHNYNLGNRTFVIGPEYEVNLPTDVLQGIASPNFAALFDPSYAATGWKYVLMFALVGSLESLLSAKAIDLIDPWRRKTNLNRDLTAIGAANTLAAFVGGLPMISEIVRSKANIDNGARTRWADFSHAVFLLLCVGVLPVVLVLIPAFRDDPQVLNHIPLAALAAMLVYTGCRLASPREFIHAYRIGREQLFIFLVTLVTTLATDLLIGVFTGVAVKILIHVINGAPIRTLFWPPVTVEARDDHTAVVTVKDSAVFTGWLSLKKKIDVIDPKMEVLIDLSETKLVDHTVMEKLHELEREYEHAGRALHVVGLEGHDSFSPHPQAARKKSKEVPIPTDRLP